MTGVLKLVVLVMSSSVDVYTGRALLEEADAGPPVVFGGGLWVHDDLVGEGIGVGGGDGGNVVLVAVHNGDDLVGGLFDRLGHGAADLENI